MNYENWLRFGYGIFIFLLLLMQQSMVIFILGNILKHSFTHGASTDKFKSVFAIEGLMNMIEHENHPSL